MTLTTTAGAAAAYLIDTSLNYESKKPVNEDLLYRELGRRVAARRSELKINQQSLADRIGLTRGSVANIERGKQRIPLHQLYRLAAALDDTPVEALLPQKDLEEAPKPSVPFELRLSKVTDEFSAEEQASIQKALNDILIAPHHAG